MTELEFHKAANIFPLDEENLSALTEDIKNNGQFKPVEIMDGKILDGRRRYVACKRLGIAPKLIEVQPEDPVAYVLSLNLHRRHLDTSQRAMIAARVKDYHTEEAKKRMREGGQTAGRGRPKQGSHQSDYPIQQDNNSRASARAGRALQVSRRSVDCATAVLNKGAPELIQAVEQGKIKVTPAAELAKKPHDFQREVLSRKKKAPDANGAATQTAVQAQNGDPKARQARIKALGLAQEAINILSRIPKTNPYRKDAFQTVRRWLKHNDTETSK